MTRTSIGKYRLIRELGAGGMGVVHTAEHEGLGKTVALKLVTPELSKNAEVVQRFFAEAKAAARIRHAGIVEVFDVGEDPVTGSAYFAMELLDGESLADKLQRQGALPIDEALAIGEQIADTLRAAHEAHIIHRDLKPDNIFLVPERLIDIGLRVKILDFGIAKLVDEAMNISVKTRTGSMMGTPHYMSPEQARDSGEVDHRSDIYALGCVLFEMVLGRVPFPGDSLGEVLGAHLHVPPPRPSELDRAVPAALDALLVAMLAKSPEQRPASMAEVAAALQELRGGVRPAAASTIVGVSRTSAAPVAPTLAATGAAVTVAPASGSAGAAAAPASTTLGGAAGAFGTTPPNPAPPRRGPMIAGLVGALALAGGGAYLVLAKDRTPASASRPEPTPAPEPASALVEPEPTPTPLAAVIDDPRNPWHLVGPPAGEPPLLGVADDAPDEVRGFRAARAVRAPSQAFYIQRHEVSWGELDPWLAEHPDAIVRRPRWVSRKPARRADRPATGVAWTTARRYCASLGGSLPSEEQWEYAARGEELRPQPWGKRRLDLARTHAFAGKRARPVAIESRDQDVTPTGIRDLAGNAQEWTADLWREPRPDADESWVQADGMAFRAVRGLPLAAQPPAALPALGAAHREPLCAAGACLKAAAELTELVGFRCVRRAP